MIHGRYSTYTKGCRCRACVTSRTREARLQRGDTAEHFEDHPYLVLNVPIAVIMRQAFSDDEAIASLATLP